MQLEKKLVELDESFREIQGLADLYEGLVEETPKDKREQEIRREEARFARQRLLQLSLHVKNQLERIQK